MKKLSINMTLFELAFTHDATVHDPYPINSYLDLVTGDVLFVYDDDRKAAKEGIPYLENKLQRERVARDPQRYLPIPGRSYGDQQDFLQEFLVSPWSDDKADMSSAQSAYRGSVGRWMETVQNHDAVDRYFEFREAKLSGLAQDFLRGHGIDPNWGSPATPPLQLELDLLNWTGIWAG
jgi:hypothetical protein